MAAVSVNTLRFEDIREGMSASFRTVIEAKDIDAFAQLTGDVCPLHVDRDFAQSKGFAKRVVHGALLDGYISRLFGVQMPGANCLLQSTRSNYRAPAFEGDEIEFEVRVKQVSEAAQAVVATTSAVNVANGQQLMTGQVQFGFTDAAPGE